MTGPTPSGPRPHRFWSFGRFVTVALPFVLSVVLVGVLRFDIQQHHQRERERQQWLWDLRARARTDWFRANLTYESQIDGMARRFRRRIQINLNRQAQSDRLDGTAVAAAMEAALDRRHCPTGTRLYVTDYRGDNRRARLLAGPGLESRGTLVADILARFIDTVPQTRASEVQRPAGAGGQVRRAFNFGYVAPPPLRPEEIDRLNRRTAAMFGGYMPQFYSFELVGRERRGRVTPAFMSERRVFVLWDCIVHRGRLLGGYLLVIPGTAELKARPITFALDELRRTGNDYPALVSLESGAGTGTPPQFLLPASHRPSPGVRAILDQIRRAEIPRESLIPHAQTVTMGDRWVWRDFVHRNLPYEILLIGTRPPLPVTWRDHVVAAVTWGVGVFWLLFAGHTWLLGRASPFDGLRVWFASFFLLIGALPLAAVFVTGSHMIESSILRELQGAADAAMTRLEQIDYSSRLVPAQYANACLEWFKDRRWIASLANAERKEVMPILRRFRAACWRRGLAMKETYFYSFRHGLEGSGPGLTRARLDRSFAAMMTPYILAAARHLYPEGMARKKIFVDPTTSAFADFMQTMEGHELHTVFLMRRSRGNLFEFSGRHVFTFQEMVVKAGDIVGWFIVRAPLEQPYRRYLWEIVQRQRWRDARTSGSDRLVNDIALVERSGPDVQILAPAAASGFWGSYPGKRLFTALTDAAFSQSRQLYVIGGEAGQRHVVQHLVFALPCQRAPGQTLGIHVDVSALNRKQANEQQALTLLVIGLGGLVMALGTTVARGFLAPLLQIESALRQVMRGDFTIRVGVPRQDELGELTRAFDAMIRGLDERERLTRFVSGTLTATLATAQVEQQTLTEREGIVLVSDLRQFTTLTEAYPPRDVVAMLNRHLETMSAAVAAWGGLIDQFIGDAIVAVFMVDDDPAFTVRQAIGSALAMRRLHEELQTERRAAGRFTYEIGIGLAIGPLLIGTLRAGERLEQLVVGATRNTAEHLEAESKLGRHTRIVAAAAVANLAAGHTFAPIAGGAGRELIAAPGRRP